MQLVTTSMDSIENVGSFLCVPFPGFHWKLMQVGLKKKRNLDQIVQIMQYKINVAQSGGAAAATKK